jgi:hypothetical protein
MFENLISSFFVDIFVLQFQDFHGVPWSKSALLKRKFNVKTFNGVSIIRRWELFNYPTGFKKLFIFENLLSSFFYDILVLGFQYFGVCQGRNPRYPNENSTLIPSRDGP